MSVSPTRLNFDMQLFCSFTPLTLVALQYDSIKRSYISSIAFFTAMAAITETPASCKVILAGSVAKTLQAEVAEGLSKLEKPPLLVGFLANADPAARMYADWTDRTCKEK